MVVVVVVVVAIITAVVDVYYIKGDDNMSMGNK